MFAFLVLLFACKGKHSNKLSSAAIDEITIGIAKTNVLMSSAVGIVGERPEQWDRYEALRSKATDKELLALTKDTNAVVRCYAIQALAERSNTNLFAITLQHLSDTAVVHTLYGCIGGSQKAGDVFLETVTKGLGNEKSFKLIEKQTATIDSLLLLERGNVLEARDRLLAELTPEKRYYTRIRQIATEENNSLAVVALSKYRKQQDKGLIEALLKDPNRQTDGFAAVRNFPDPFFFPFLQQALMDEVTKVNSGGEKKLQLLYQAIVQYKDKPSRQLLQGALQTAQGRQLIYHSDYLYQALKKYPAPIYGGLLKPTYAATPTATSGT